MADLIVKRPFPRNYQPNDGWWLSAVTPVLAAQWPAIGDASRNCSYVTPARVIDRVYILQGQPDDGWIPKVVDQAIAKTAAATILDFTRNTAATAASITLHGYLWPPPLAPPPASTWPPVSPPVTVAYVLSQTLGTTTTALATGRHYGFEFTTGNSPPAVTHLGRWKISGNNQLHTLDLVLESSGPSWASVASATVDMSGPEAAGDYVYAALATQVALLANRTYAVVSTEQVATDAIYSESNTTQDSYTPGVGAAGGGMYLTSGFASAVEFGDPPNTYGPTNFRTLVPVFDSTILVAPLAQSVTSYLPPGAAQFDVRLHALSPEISWLKVPLGIEAVFGSQPYVLTQTVGTARNNFTGYVGFYFDTGPNTPIVTALGRWKIAGNTQTHTVVLIQYIDGVNDIEVAFTNVPTASGAANAFIYSSSFGTVQLLPNTRYYVLSTETSGLDQFYDDDDTTLDSFQPGVGTLGGSVINTGETNFGAHLAAPHGFGPVNFKFRVFLGIQQATVAPTTQQTGSSFRSRDTDKGAFQFLLQTNPNDGWQVIGAIAPILAQQQPASVQGLSSYRTFDRVVDRFYILQTDPNDGWQLVGAVTPILASQWPAIEELVSFRVPDRQNGLVSVLLTSPSDGWITNVAAPPFSATIVVAPVAEQVKSFRLADSACIDVRQTQPNQGWQKGAISLWEAPLYVPITDSIRNAYLQPTRPGLSLGTHDTAPEIAWIVTTLPPPYAPVSDETRNSYRTDAWPCLRLGIHDTSPEFSWLQASVDLLFPADYAPVSGQQSGSFRSPDRAVLSQFYTTAPQPAWITTSLVVFDPALAAPANDVRRNSYLVDSRPVLQNGIHDTAPQFNCLTAVLGLWEASQYVSISDMGRNSYLPDARAGFTFGIHDTVSMQRRDFPIPSVVNYVTVFMFRRIA